MAAENPQNLLEAGEVYPLIISFTACDENLSIQVHPVIDEYAQSVENLPYEKWSLVFYWSAGNRLDLCWNSKTLENQLF